MLQFRTGMNRRQFLALLNSKPIQKFQFSAENTATLALQKQQAEQFWPTPSKKPKVVFEPVEKENVNVDSTKLAERRYPSRNPRQFIHIEYEMGKSGNKLLHIRMSVEGTFNNFPNILVPQDLFGFVRAMDGVLDAVNANRSIIEASFNRQERLYLHTAKATGVTYDYRLDLYVFNNSVQVQMRTVPKEYKPDHKPRFFYISLHQFHWLRQAIGELFVENGEENVQQQLGKPLGYPDWLNRDGTPLVLLSNNQAQSQMPPQQQQGMLQQLLQLVLQQQQQLQQMQVVRNNNLNLGMGSAGFSGVVPQGADQTILMYQKISDLLEQQLQQQQTTYNYNQFYYDQTALANLLAQFQQPQQPTAPTINNNNQFMNLVNLLLQNNSGQQN